MIVYKGMVSEFEINTIISEIIQHNDFTDYLCSYKSHFVIENIVAKIIAKYSEATVAIEKNLLYIGFKALTTQELNKIVAVQNRIQQVKLAITPLVEKFSVIIESLNKKQPQYKAISINFESIFKRHLDSLNNFLKRLDATNEQVKNILTTNSNYLGAEENKITKKIAAIGLLIAVAALIITFLSLDTEFTKAVRTTYWWISFALTFFIEVGIFFAFKKYKWL